ncbi:hypothetical protein [Corallococcus exercitus]|uniref:hypothetical protein n=1 Tax=Corallococcus exercitus TaxID=2316736 RepID=UPI0035D4314D
MLTPVLTTIAHLEYIGAQFGLAGLSRQLRPEVGALCEAWRQSQPPMDHPAVQMTQLLQANGFGTNEALQLGLHHGPFPEFKQVNPYPDALVAKVPVDPLAQPLGLPRDPQALLAAYASALRDHWRLSGFDTVMGALPAPERPWAAHLPGADAVSWMQRYAAVPLPQRIDFVPLRSLPWEERYAVRGGHGPDEHVHLFFGEPPSGNRPEQVGHELTRGLLYHVLGGAVSRRMEPHRQAVNESGQQLYRLVESWVDPSVRGTRDWFSHVRRFTIYAFVSRLFVQQGMETPPARDDCRLGTPFQPIYWFYAQVVAAERDGVCDVGDVVDRVVTGLQADPARLLAEWEEPRPFPGCMRNCFMPYWMRRKTLAIVPRSGMTTSEVQRLVATLWGRNFPVVQADQWSAQRHGNSNLILFGRPEESPPLAEWFERNGRQPAGDTQLSLEEHLRRGHQVLAASASPWERNAWVYVHASAEPAAISPYRQAAWTMHQFVALDGGQAVGRGTL